MKKLLLTFLAGLFVGVAVYAVTDYVTVKVLFEQTTTWPVVWHTVCDIKGVDKSTCDAACRKQLVGSYMRGLLYEKLCERIFGDAASEARSQAEAQIQALESIIE